MEAGWSRSARSVTPVACFGMEKLPLFIGSRAWTLMVKINSVEPARLGRAQNALVPEIRGLLRGFRRSAQCAMRRRPGTMLSGRGPVRLQRGVEIYHYIPLRKRRRKKKTLKFGTRGMAQELALFVGLDALGGYRNAKLAT